MTARVITACYIIMLCNTFNIGRLNNTIVGQNYNLRCENVHM